ncbi:MAG: PQQ-binding-like beta-propeller repeat protein [Candidatus Bathyarchaeia archaeon]
MKLSKNRKTLAVVLTLALATTILMTQATFANAAAQVDTYAYISAVPSPIGVGQQLTVLIWLNHAPPTAAGPKGDRWEGMKVTITKPDGTTEVQGPFRSDDVGAAFFSYTPTMAGNYTMQMSYPGQTLTGIPGNENATGVGDYYKPSTSRKITVVVQQQPVPFLPEVPAPEYWERPLYAENRELYVLGSNWLMAAYSVTGRSFDAGSAVAPNNRAPNSAHILWTRPLIDGGLVGVEQPSVAYYQRLSYESMFTPPLVINGKLYYNTPNDPHYGFYCVDLTDGKTIYYSNLTKPYTAVPNEGGFFPGVLPITLGQILDYESPNQHGAIPYLWAQVGTTWSMYDALTGNWILDIKNVPSGTAVFGPHGELLIYALNGATNTLIVWNSTKAIPPPWFTGSGYWQWRPDLYRGQTLDGTVGVELNVTVPDEPGSQAIRQVTGDVIYASSGDRWIGYNRWTGAKLWAANITRPQYPPGIYRGGAATLSPYQINDGVFTEFIRETMQWYGYDVQTGQYMWGPTERYSSDWGYYNGYTGRVAGYSKIFSAGYDGTVRAYDIKTGKLLWEYYSGSAGFETPYGTWPFYGGLTIADGKVFAMNGEHSPGTPLWKGEKIFAIDATTGQLVWKISGWFQGNSIVAVDGRLIGLNCYDNQIYSFGKGPSATTVTAPDTAVTVGTGIMIRGTVTDQSPGAKGAAAVADDSMSAWMEYLYMQKAIPGDAKGVEVKLTAIDPNGNSQDIGTATTDLAGKFGLMWTPPVPGKYQIIATFEGSNSYASSFDTTYIAAVTAPSASPATPPPPPTTVPPTTVPPPPTTPPASPSPPPTSVPTPPAGGVPSETVVIAVAAVVIVVAAAAAAVILRRRK